MSKLMSVIVTSFVIVLALSGCGSSSSSKTSASASGSASAQTVQASSASVSAASAGASANAGQSGSSASAVEASHDGEAQPPLSRKDVSGRNYQDVVTMFENAGFTNIQTEGKGDLKTGLLHDEGDVDEVSINGDVKYNQDAWYPLDAKIVVRYHSYPAGKGSAAQQGGATSVAAQAAAASVPKEYVTALRKAESYSNLMHMSKAAIYDQLVSEYGENYSAEAAQYAVDNIQADWNANALAKARDYQELMNMSPAAIYDQLISEYGEQFTPEEAQYAIDNL